MRDNSFKMEKSFIELFERQVLKTPANIAIVFEQEQLTYQELNEMSNMLAHYLQTQGVNEETLVPLYLERGINMIVGMLGIMKAGAAYVPIDTDFPSERIDYMLQDTAARIVVSSEKSASKIASVVGINVVKIECITKKECISNPLKINLASKIQSNHLAYVIYTSGSTGSPKGVMVEHGNIVDYVSGLNKATGINQCRSFGLVSTIATDLGNTVIYASLLSGGALHVFSKEAVSDAAFLQGYFEDHEIECLKIVPSHWKALCTAEALLLPKKLLVFGGEALSATIIEEIRSSGTHCQIVNHYGPTETTIGKLLHVVEYDRTYGSTIPVGKPFSNTKVLVLTKN